MGVTHIYDVEVRMDSDSKVYQHYLAQKGGNEFSCGVAIKKALSDALYGLLEERIPEVADNLPAADVVERKRGRCKFCGGNDNTFHIINAETAAYSGIEIAINRQGMLRVRVYDDYECETALPRSSEIVMIAACPKCGADMRRANHE